MGTSGTRVQYVIVDRLGAFFIEPDLFESVCRSTIPLRFIWSICSGNYDL